MSIGALFTGICARYEWKYPETSLICALAGVFLRVSRVSHLLCLRIRLSSLLSLFSLPLYNETSKIYAHGFSYFDLSACSTFCFLFATNAIALVVKAAMELIVKN